MELTEAQLGTDIQVRMEAHFASQLNAWRVMIDVANLPEGLTLKSFSRGNGSWIDYINGDGDEDTFKPSLTSSVETGVCLGMCMEQDNNGDILMWTGDHADFVRVTFTVGADFKGGVINWAVEPSGGTCPPNSHYDLSATWTVPAGPVNPTPAPAPVIGYNDAGQVIATAEGHTVQLYLNGNPVDQPYTLPAATWETQTLTFTAVTQPGENETATESVEPFVVTIDPLQPTAAPAPTIGYNDAGQVIATCEGPNTVQLYLNGNAVDQPYTLPAATDVDQVLTFTATTLPGEHEVATSTTEPFVVTIPAVVVPPTPTNTCARPECGYVITGDQEVTVTITNNEPNATVFWYYTDPETNELVEGSFTGESEQIVVNGIGVYTITCYASMVGNADWANSPEGGCFFEITEDTTVGIDELVNGKTVAGVRYFNMAGQEMQVANGMTIVVTTYTDGTTSAVKVMK